MNGVSCDIPGDRTGQRPGDRFDRLSCEQEHLEETPLGGLAGTSGVGRGSNTRCPGVYPAENRR